MFELGHSTIAHPSFGEFLSAAWCHHSEHGSPGPVVARGIGEGQAFRRTMVAYTVVLSLLASAYTLVMRSHYRRSMHSHCSSLTLRKLRCSESSRCRRAPSCPTSRLPCRVDNEVNLDDCESHASLPLSRRPYRIKDHTLQRWSAAHTLTQAKRIGPCRWP